MRTFVITDDECSEIYFVMEVIAVPEDADLDTLFAAFLADYGDGQGELDARRLRNEGYMSHEAARLFSDWLTRQPDFRPLLFQELNTTRRLEAERERLAKHADR